MKRAPSHRPIPAASPRTRMATLENRFRKRMRAETQEARDQRIDEIRERLITNEFGTAYAQVEKRPDKKTSEDRLAIGNGVMAVCDGVSTADTPAQVGAQNAAEMMTEAFGDQFREDLSKQTDKQTFVEEQGLLFLQSANEVVQGSQTTLSGAILWKNDNNEQMATIVHTGDSKIYVLHNDEIKPLTVDESFARGMLDQAAKERDPQRQEGMRIMANNPNMAQVITNSLGYPKSNFTIRDNGRGNVHTVRIPEGATLILTSDGLEKAHPTESVDPEGHHLGEQMRSIATSAIEQHGRAGGKPENTPEAISKALFQDAQQKGLQDDYGTIVFQTHIPNLAETAELKLPDNLIKHTEQTGLQQSEAETQLLPSFEEMQRIINEAAEPLKKEAGGDTIVAPLELRPELGETISLPSFASLEQQQKTQTIQEQRQQSKIAFEEGIQQIREQFGEAKIESSTQYRLQQLTGKNTILAPPEVQYALTGKVLDDVFAPLIQSVESDSNEAINLVFEKSTIQDMIQDELQTVQPDQSFAQSLLAIENELRLLPQTERQRTPQQQRTYIEMIGMRDYYADKLIQHYREQQAQGQ